MARERRRPDADGLDGYDNGRAFVTPPALLNNQLFHKKEDYVQENEWHSTKTNNYEDGV
jgi:hypothetical protein